MTPTETDRARLADWLSRQVIADARGDRLSESSTKPADRFWLGRLAPEDDAWKTAMGERGRRLDPCACGFRFRPKKWSWVATVSFYVWTRDNDTEGRPWVKGDRASVQIPITMAPNPGSESFGKDRLESALQALGITTHQARLDSTVEPAHDEAGKLDVTVVLVNETPSKQRGVDPNLYEVRLELEVGDLEDIYLDALPDSFRYDRKVPAFGIYGGVDYISGKLRTTDAIVADRRRPTYWDQDVASEPDLSFDTLAIDPLPQLHALVDAHRAWGEQYWSATRLDERAAAESWTDEMRDEASDEAAKFEHEGKALSAGLQALKVPHILEAFILTNRAFRHSSRGEYVGWRPFQLGFLLTILPSLIDPVDSRRRVVDTLWFATGGGKTETYLAAIIVLLSPRPDDGASCTASRRGAGSRCGCSRCSRRSGLPTRLQAPSCSGRADGIAGDPLALGFLVGGPPNGTPNAIRSDAEPRDARRRRPHDARAVPGASALSLLLRDPTSRCGSTAALAARAQLHQPGLPVGERAPAVLRASTRRSTASCPASSLARSTRPLRSAIQAAMRGCTARRSARCSSTATASPTRHGRAGPNGCLVPGARRTPARSAQAT